MREIHSGFGASTYWKTFRDSAIGPGKNIAQNVGYWGSLGTGTLGEAAWWLSFPFVTEAAISTSTYIGVGVGGEVGSLLIFLASTNKGQELLRALAEKIKGTAEGAALAEKIKTYFSHGIHWTMPASFIQPAAPRNQEINQQPDENQPLMPRQASSAEETQCCGGFYSYVQAAGRITTSCFWGLYKSTKQDPNYQAQPGQQV